MKQFLSFIISAFCVLTGSAHDLKSNMPYSVTAVDHQQGLSFSAVFCFFQDTNGMMWIGTYDGLNCWDGRNMEVFRSEVSTESSLNNNVIHDINKADGDNLWISTYLGVNRLSKNARKITASFDFKDYSLHSNSKGNTWVIEQDTIHYYNPSIQEFVKMKSPVSIGEEMNKRAFVTEDGVLWMFPDSTGNLVKVNIGDFASIHPNSAVVTTSAFHHKPISKIFFKNGIACFVDSDKDLYVYDFSHNTKLNLRNIGSLMAGKDEIMGIVPFEDDIIIAFKTHGLMRLCSSNNYTAEMLERNVRVFDIYHDPRQNILWVATDGQGALLYSRKRSIASNLMLSRLSPNLNRQIRSILTDSNGDLWFGTKGDGLIHIRGYADGFIPENGEVLSPEGRCPVTSYSKWGSEIHVYELSRSKWHNGFWVGSSKPGLMFYSYDSDRLIPVKYDTEENVEEVHAIFEANDSILYAATSGQGLMKITVGRDGDSFRVRKLKGHSFFSEQKEINIFYPMVIQNDSILWLGSRGQGLVKYNINSEEYTVISLRRALHRSLDDILSLGINGKGDILVGTTSGYVEMPLGKNQREPRYIGRAQGLLNDMIHGILQSKDGIVWMSTNRGIVKFNSENESLHTIYHSNGIQVGEFSDDAYYRCPFTGRLFFGGIEGLVCIEDIEDKAPEENLAEIFLRKLTIGNTRKNVDDYFNENRDGLVFEAGDNSFTLTFTVPDFLTANDIEYSYLLEGHDREWSVFSNVNEVNYTDLPAGKYTLKVRYKKDVFDSEYRYYSLSVRVLPPWYLSPAAWIAYIVILCFLGYAGYLGVRYFRMRRISRHHESNRNLKDPRIMDDFRDSFPNRFILTSTLDVSRTLRQMSDIILPSGEGKELARIKVMCPDDLRFHVFSMAFHTIIHYSLQFLSRDQNREIEVRAQSHDGKLDVTFKTAPERIRELYNILTGHDMPEETGEREEILHALLMTRFVQSAIDTTGTTVVTDENSDILTLTFLQADMSENTNEEKKTVVLLENHEETTWLISNLLADDYIVISVPSLEKALSVIRTSEVSLFIADMRAYAGNEKKFLDQFNRNSQILARIPFIPMLSIEGDIEMKRRLVLMADSTLSHPYDIKYLREFVHVAVNGKGRAQRIEMDNLGELSSHICCTTKEQTLFVTKLLGVISDNMKLEEFGANFIAERLNMSPRNFYRWLKMVCDLSLSDLIRFYRMERSAQLLRDSDIPIQEIIEEVGISSRSYFYKSFSATFSMTPKEYRERCRSEVPVESE